MIPKIVKGAGISGALAYVMGQGNDATTKERLELAPGEQSRAELLGGQNFGFAINTAERLELARRVMEWQGLPENQGSLTRKQTLDCLHASLSWQPGETPNRAEMIEAAQGFLKAIGLEGARAVFVAHDDTDHPHLHIVASRIDPETGKTLRVDYDKAAAQEWALDWEEKHGQQRKEGKGLHELRSAVKGQDVEAVLSYLTRDKPTFEAWELNRALQYGGLKGEARDKFRDLIIGHANTIGLREDEGGEVTRYTTRETLFAEMIVERSAAQLAEDERHGISAAQVQKASKAFTLKPEQAEALRHLTGAPGFSMLWGEAGTGKSHTLNAVRSAYEAAGKTVIGLAWTNDVAEAMHRDGFRLAGTIASQLLAIEKGRNAWTRDTVLIVDEAAMISTENLARLMGAARHVGAKLILAGDDKQLASIERGGMFETLRQTHGAAILTDVQRVKDQAQKTALNQMHKGSFAEALKTFDKMGGVHWTTKQSDALKAMAEKYTADLAADPDKKRFMFAYTNKDVATLNAHARALHKARGDLGIEQTLFAKDGPAQFATGDRMQFSGTARDKSQKRAGLTNGRVGTIASITFTKDHKARVTVALDVGRNDKPQSVTFIVGDNEKAGEFNSFKLGYAGTIYRGQGRTLDYAYVAHTAQWRSSAAYVALSRHREQVHIFAARETVKDLDAMAKGLARSDNKRAATAYRIDTADKAKLEKAVLAFEAGAQAPAAQSAKSDRTPLTPPAAGFKIELGGPRTTTRDADTAPGGIMKALSFMSGALSALIGENPTAPTPRDKDPARTQAEADLAARRAQFIQDFGEDLADEHEHDPDKDLSRGRKRRRGE